MQTHTHVHTHTHKHTHTNTHTKTDTHTHTHTDTQAQAHTIRSLSEYGDSVCPLFPYSFSSPSELSEESAAEPWQGQDTALPKRIDKHLRNLGGREGGGGTHVPE